MFTLKHIYIQHTKKKKMIDNGYEIHKGTKKASLWIVFRIIIFLYDIELLLYFIKLFGYTEMGR